MDWSRKSVDSSKGAVTVFVSDKNWGKSKKIGLRITIDLSEAGGLNFKSEREIVDIWCVSQERID